jgi:hypothetical protein
MSTRSSSFYRQHRARFAAAGVIVRSSNYTLYGDMSARVMSVLSRFAPDLKIYSIVVRQHHDRLAAQFRLEHALARHIEIVAVDEGERARHVTACGCCA